MSITVIKNSSNNSNNIPNNIEDRSKRQRSLVGFMSPDGFLDDSSGDNGHYVCQRPCHRGGHCAGPIHHTVIYTFIGSHLVLIKSSTHQFVRPAQPGRSAERPKKAVCFKSQLIVPPSTGRGWGGGSSRVRGLTSVHLSPLDVIQGPHGFKRSIQLEL